MAARQSRPSSQHAGNTVRGICTLRVIGLIATVVAFGSAWRVVRRRRPERIACLVMFVLQVGLFAQWLSGMLAVSLGRGPPWLPGGAVLDPRVQMTFQTVSDGDSGINGELFLSLAEARCVVDCWRLDYNRRRPHRRRVLRSSLRIINRFSHMTWHKKRGGVTTGMAARSVGACLA